MTFLLHPLPDLLTAAEIALCILLLAVAAAASVYVGCRDCLYGVGLLAVLAAGYFYIAHVKSAAAADARAKAVAEMQAATAAESQRRDQVIAYWQRFAQSLDDQAKQKDAKIEQLQADSARLSAKNDRTACFDRSARDRIAGVGRVRQ